MLLRHLRYLSAVVEHGSLTRAAQALHVSQPALSQQIRQLEEQLGVQLLDRSRKAVRATDAGSTYLSHIHRAFREIDAASRATQDVNDLSSGSLRLGFTSSFGGYLIAPLARRFRERYPGITLDLSALSQDEIEADLANAVAFEKDDLRFRPLLPAIEERRVVLLQREGGYRSAAARALVSTLDLFVQELGAPSLK